MNKRQIEDWARRVMEQVERGQPNEDTFAELKTTWVEAPKTARQIAAHANAARGQPILWLIGVDAKTGVNGVPAEELANWWPQVQKEFEGGVTPDLTDVNITYGEKTVVALFFQTDRSPFVVKSHNGLCEVPWREGTQTRSATRVNLLRLLTPLQNLPIIEVLSANVSLRDIDKAGVFCSWAAWLELYITMPGRERGFIPRHKSKLAVRFGNNQYRMQEISFSAHTHVENPFCTVAANTEHLMVTGAGMATMNGSVNINTNKDELRQYFGQVEMTLDLGIAGDDRSTTAAVELSFASDAPNFRQWGDIKSPR